MVRKFPARWFIDFNLVTDLFYIISLFWKIEMYSYKLLNKNRFKLDFLTKYFVKSGRT